MQTQMEEKIEEKVTGISDTLMPLKEDTKGFKFRIKYVMTLLVMFGGTAIFMFTDKLTGGEWRKLMFDCLLVICIGFVGKKASDALGKRMERGA